MEDFFRNRHIFLTGHTGFKGAWLTRILQFMGARVTGCALAPESGCAYEQIVDKSAIDSDIADIRDFAALQSSFNKADPEIVFHLAAQPLVLDAFERPAYTFDVNVQGTVNLLECVRKSKRAKSVVIVTTDKVYKNREWAWGYRENDALGDIEPYAASKACAEIAAGSYAKTFLKKCGIALSTVRAGNVIGGGDISKNRIIPDCIRAAQNNNPVIVRNPHAVRPYQHVLEPLFAYLMVSKRQFETPELAGQFNIGPADDGCVTTGELVEIFCDAWGGGQSWENRSLPDAPHESGLLKLDCSQMRSRFGWGPKWDIRSAIAKTIEWEKAPDKQAITDRQIVEYFAMYK